MVVVVGITRRSMMRIGGGKGTVLPLPGMCESTDKIIRSNETWLISGFRPLGTRLEVTK